MGSSVRSSHVIDLPSEKILPVRGIIFDMDGVIVDSEPRHQQAFLEVFAELGYADSHGVDFDLYLGKTDRAVWQDFLKRNQSAETLEALLRRKELRLIELIQSDRPLFEPIPELLRDLALDYSLSVASGSPHRVIEAVLALEDLSRYFPVVVSAEDVPRGKPAPDIFLEAAYRMKMDPTELCVVEDSAAGVAAAKAAGMQVIAITNSLPAEKLFEADCVIADYAEIFRILCDSGEG